MSTINNKWIIKNGPGDLAWIELGLLGIDGEYQRKLNGARVLKLASEWSWLACGALIVADRNGIFWVVDGQHRMAAARKRGDIKQLPCVVFQTDGRASEASGFIDANTNRKSMAAVDKFNAMLVAGDETALFVQEVFDRLGISVHGRSRGGIEIKCVNRAYEIAQRSRGEFEIVMAMVASISDQSIDFRMLDGIDYLNGVYGLEDQRLASRIKDAGAKALLDGIAVACAYYKKGGRKVYGNGILNVVNHRLKNKYGEVKA